MCWAPLSGPKKREREEGTRERFRRKKEREREGEKSGFPGLPPVVAQAVHCAKMLALVRGWSTMPEGLCLFLNLPGALYRPAVALGFRG